MRTFKEFQFLNESDGFPTSEEAIHEACEKYGIEDYQIVDGKVNVEGDVYLFRKNLTRLPVRFGIVKGYFWCSNNKLTSLEGCPKTVGRNFYCSNNNLTSLEGCPKTVGGNFYCSNNNLTSLEGSPETVGGSFDCSDNKLISIKGIPKIGGQFICKNNPISKILDSGQKFDV